MSLISSGLGMHDFAFATLRASVGIFFAISGYHKLTNKQRHAGLVETFKADKIPFIKFNEWFVPSVEMGAGVFLTVGFLSTISALMLASICLVATCTDGLKRIKEWNPIDKADVLDDVLYLPEVLLGLMLLAVIVGGAGAWSLDAVLF